MRVTDVSKKWITGAAMSEILIAEDEVKIATVMRDYIQQAGHQVRLIADGIEAIAAVRDTMPDLIVLDIMLPGCDGLDVCKTVRAFSDVPIIMVTARVEEIDRLIGLELGADDYVCKPFSPRELVARIKSNLRRSNGNTRPVSDSVSNGLTIDPDAHAASLDGQGLELTPVEFRLLVTLSEHAGRVWSRDGLLDHMYSDFRVVSDRTVDSHITNLRRKLQTVRPSEDCIRSIYGVGYKLELAG